MSIAKLKCVAQDILNHFQYAPPVLKKNIHQELSDVVAGTYDDDTILRTFRKMNVGVGDTWDSPYALNVELKGEPSSVDEATGNVYRMLNIEFCVSWHSHITKKPPGPEALALVDQYMRMIDLAETLTEKYAAEPFKIFIRSAQDEAQRKLKNELLAHISNVRTLSEHATKGLRAMSKRRVLPKIMFTGIPNGVYDFSLQASNYETKNYSVLITDQAGYLTRTK